MLAIIILGLFGFLSVILSTAPPKATAATNNYLNYQMRLLTSSGAIVADGSYNIEFKLYDLANSTGSSQGSCTGDTHCLWVETRTGGNTVSTVNGYLSVNLGSVASLPSINWDQQLWLGVRIGGTGTPSWETIELTSDGTATGNKIALTGVPYAFRTGTLAKFNGTQTGTLSFNTVANSPAISLPDASGTVCLQAASACGFEATSGTDFIRNQTGVQAANFNVQSVSTTSVTATIQGMAAQTADALKVITANDSPWAIMINNATYSTADASGFGFWQSNAGRGAIDILGTTAILLGTNKNVGIGTATTSDPPARLTVSGSGTTGSLFTVIDTTATAQNVLDIVDGGATTFRNQTDSTAAFQVQNAAGATDLKIDTSNSQTTVSNSGGNASSDEFNSGSSPGAQWTLYADDASTATVSGGNLIITPVATSNHDCWQNGTGPNYTNCLRLVESSPTTTGNLQLDTKLVNQPPNANAAVGIIVWQDYQNFLRFEYANGGAFNYHDVIANTGHSFVFGCSPGAAPEYMRVIRQGNLWTLLYSTNGVNFFSCGSIDLNATYGVSNFTVNNVGVHVIKTATSWTTSLPTFDYFRVSLPALLVAGSVRIQAGSDGNMLQAEDSGGAPILNLKQVDNNWFLTANVTTRFQNTTNSTTSFQIQNSTAVNIFTADTSGNKVQIGSATTNATAVLLILDSYNNATDPTEVDGAMYYSSALGQFRCGINGFWSDCSINNVQYSYNFQDDFLGGNTVASGTTSINNVGSLGWNVTATTLCAVGYNQTGPALAHDNPGTLRLQGGAANGDGCTMTQGGTAAGTPTLSDIVAAGDVIKTAVAVDSVARGTMRVGINNATNNTAPTSGAWWEYVNGTDATHWRYCYANNAAATCAASTLTISANTWYQLEIRFISSTAITFTVRASGGSLETHALTGITYDAGATNKLGPMFSCFASTANAYNCFMDYFQWRGYVTTSGGR